MDQMALFRALSSQSGGNQGAPGLQSLAPPAPPVAAPPAMGGGPLYQALVNAQQPQTPSDAQKAAAKSLRQAFGMPEPTPTPTPQAS